jgi:hypothetical protein
VKQQHHQQASSSTLPDDGMCVMSSFKMNGKQISHGNKLDDFNSTKSSLPLPVCHHIYVVCVKGRLLS